MGEYILIRTYIPKFEITSWVGRRISFLCDSRIHRATLNRARGSSIVGNRPIELRGDFLYTWPRSQGFFLCRVGGPGGFQSGGRVAGLRGGDHLRDGRGIGGGGDISATAFGSMGAAVQSGISASCIARATAGSNSILLRSGFGHAIRPCPDAYRFRMRRGASRVSSG